MSTINKRSAPVTPKGFNHLVLNVRNMDESHRFWSGLLGFRQVGELHRGMTMRFYAGARDHHHELALVESPNMPEPPDKWTMAPTDMQVNHIAITYPDRESWLEQVQFLKEQGVNMNLRINHGMTHSVYVNDPNGYGVEVLYDLPRDVWEHDVDGALNYAESLPMEQLLVDSTDYTTDFSKRPNVR